MDFTRPQMTTDEILQVLHYRKNKKHVRKSDYSHVSVFEYNKVLYYKAQIAKYRWHKFFTDEKEAAKAVDMKLIENNQQPKNILKAK